MERLLRFRSEHPSKHVNINGIHWQYIVCGKGTETLLLLPGGLRLAESAVDYIQMFEDAYRLIVPTYPPLGVMDDIVDGVVNILDEEQISEVFVLGQSYGSAVAQVLLQRHPSRVKKVILSGAAPLIAVKWKTLLLHLLIMVATLLPEWVVMRLYRRIVSPLVTVQQSKRAFWKTYLYELFEQRLNKADALSHLQTLLDAQLKYACARGERSSWSGNMLVIWGENDPHRNEKSQKGILEIYPQAQIHIILESGHTVAMSEPKKYSRAVKSFLNKK
jgi:pimeloyl-ACP methyl ester carboxylesterase